MVTKSTINRISKPDIGEVARKFFESSTVLKNVGHIGWPTKKIWVIDRLMQPILSPFQLDFIIAAKADMTLYTGQLKLGLDLFLTQSH